MNIVNGTERPERLLPETRALARRVLAGETGRYLGETLGLEVEDSERYRQMTEAGKRAYCIDLIARKAPIRLIEGEYLAGSATLGGALFGATAVWLPEHRKETVRSRRFEFISVNHVTPDFEKALRVGCKGIRREVEESLARHRADPAEGENSEAVDTLAAMLSCLDSLSVWHERYMKALEERIETSLGPVKKRYMMVRDNLRNVPENPPVNFREAVQSLWFLFAFFRLSGNWPGIGRMDRMLGPYLRNDLAAGRITLDVAREYLAHLWIKGAEWCTGATDTAHDGTGDGQYYQNVILSGIDADGNDVTNEVTFLILDVVEELGISDYPISVRLREDSDPKLLRRTAEVMKLGGGILAVYNERLVIDALTDAGYPLREAREFANDGCWEIQIPGKTCFRYHAYDLVRLLQQEVLAMGKEGPSELPYKDFEDVFRAFSAAHAAYLRKVVAATPDQLHFPETNSLLMSLLTEGCVDSGVPYWNGGAKYRVLSPHPGGMPDVADALLAIRYLTYERKLVSLNELVDILKADWQGHEALRQTARNRIVYYGNDDDAADAMMVRVYDDFIDSLAAIPSVEGYLNPPGISTFGRQVKWKNERLAMPNGRHAGEVLAHNIDPEPGTDMVGATAVIRSYAKMDLRRLTNGTALTLRMLPSVVRGGDGTAAVEDLLLGFVRLGGLFLQFDVLDTEAMLDAKKHPEDHGSLTVRVSGWSARFTSLSEEYQDMVIRTTGQTV